MSARRIQRSVSRTKHGTYKKKLWSMDFEKLPWIHWLEIDPMRYEEEQIFKFLYPILLQEINTKSPSRILHFLIGKGVLYWQDAVIIQHARQTDLEQNTPFLKIIATRGRAGFYGLIDALRSRRGSWQGYLADMLDMKYNLASIKDMLDIYKIVCHDLIKIMPVGWSALPRVLGLSPQKINECRRNNKLPTNQVLHSLMMWTGKRTDNDTLLAELIVGLRKINRADIASGIIILVNSVHEYEVQENVNAEFRSNVEDDADKETGRSCANSPEKDTRFGGSESCFSDELPEFGQTDSDIRGSFSERCATAPPGRFLSGGDSGLRSTSPAQSTKVIRIGGKRSLRSKTNNIESIHQPELTRFQVAKVFNFGISPRSAQNEWEKRRPSILQMDYMTNPSKDNMFMDYLVYQ